MLPVGALNFLKLWWCLSLWGLLSQITTVGLHINNRNLFLTVLQAESSRSRSQHDRVPVRAILPVHRQCLLAVFSHARGARELCRVS